MSWSVGNTEPLPPQEAAEIIEKQFETSGPCVEPEESIRQLARGLIAKALAATTRKNFKVAVNAYGSQSMDYETRETANSLSIRIDLEG